MLHRIREVFHLEMACFSAQLKLINPIWVVRNPTSTNTKKLHQSRGVTGKTAVLGFKVRDTNKVKVKVFENTKRKTLHGYIHYNVEENLNVCTNDFMNHENLNGYDHKTVSNSVAVFVNEQIHINGVELIWSTIKRAHRGDYHKMSVRHPDRNGIILWSP